ncbi:histidine kinase [Taibaiella koreensis]|uniref:histidine kinase n=1 Tax=Taibaiella koreensis TaxID=1268548 RepID=UPI000E59E3F5|nr:histidine kinase [Taibaiella koreensis]
MFHYRISRNLWIGLLLGISLTPAQAQPDSTTVLTFDFNQHEIAENNHRSPVRASAAVLATDRFGNKQSAVYLNGTENSYLNLGTSSLLKPHAGTISIWIKLHRRIYIGKGQASNPVIITKNGPGDDFIVAYSMGYDSYANRLVVHTTKDSTTEASIASIEEMQFNQWRHLAMTFDNHQMCFYIDGELQGCMAKNFETVYLSADSVVVGNTASKKNSRFSLGIFDDIQIFHRVLSPAEIKGLYEAPDPNRWRPVIDYAGKALLLLALVTGLSYLLLRNRRRSLKRKEEQLLLSNRLQEMELRAVRAQMNPHFIFNSLNSIQHFVITREHEKAQLYLSKFSRLVRKLLESNIGESIPLEDELDILHRYLEMESLRFNNAFHYTIRVDENIDIARSAIPHLMIQPFVENAIWHGLLAKTGDKELMIAFTRPADAVLCCIIEDNGIGRGSATKGPVEVHKEKSLAIGFIRQRLALLSKDRQQHFTLQIIDKKNNDGSNAGTRIEITLPQFRQPERSTGKETQQSLKKT